MVEYIQTNTYGRSKSNGTAPDQEFTYRRYLRIMPLEAESYKKLYHDEELGICFESPESYHSYEIEVEDVHVEIAKEFRKAHDFLRRLNYKYDWIHFEKSDMGKITGVSNLDELRRNWTKLKERVIKDYKGEPAVFYLEKISVDFEDDKHFEDIFRQYHEYGLLFSPIPKSHGETWSTVRFIKLDNTPRTELKETITYTGMEGDTRSYVMGWEKQDPDSPIEIKEAEGNLEYCVLSNTLQRAEARILFAYDGTITNKWHFRLQKIKN